MSSLDGCLCTARFACCIGSRGQEVFERGRQAPPVAIRFARRRCELQDPAESAPASEREGTVTVECSASVWAQELTLLEADLRGRLNAALKGQTVRSLRFVVKAP